MNSAPAAAPAAASAAPPWQQLSGLTPGAEAKMSDEQRDEAIRVLMKKVDELAAAEFQRRVPEGERSFIWNPIERICFRLGIARTKLSHFCRELTGLSAYEWADRHPARALGEKLHDWAAGLLKDLPERMKKSLGDMRSLKEDFKIRWRECALEIVRAARKGSSMLRWASALKFPNLARLRRACLMVHGATIEELEERTVHQLVQKFFEQLEAHMHTLPPPEFLFGSYIRTADFVKDFGFIPKTLKEFDAALEERCVRQRKEDEERKAREVKERAQQEEKERLEREQRQRQSDAQQRGSGGFGSFA